MTLEVDKTIYDDICISNAVYSLSDRCTIKRNSESSKEILEVTPKNGAELKEQDIIDVLNDFHLRRLISLETKEIRTVLYAKAFGDLDGFEE